MNEIQAEAKDTAAGKAAFTLTSPDIANGKKIPKAQVFNSFGCKRDNVSRTLSWSNVPAGTKSFARLVHDHDAPTGSGWGHWIAYNIAADATAFPADAGDPKKNLMPGGAVQGRNGR